MGHKARLGHLESEVTLDLPDHLDSKVARAALD